MYLKLNYLVKIKQFYDLNSSQDFFFGCAPSAKAQANTDGSGYT